jgi:hypothetical protein
MIFSIIPFLNLWAAYRIEKLLWFVIVLIGISVINFGVTFVILFPFSIAVYIAIYVILVIYFMRKWTIEWNGRVT